MPVVELFREFQGFCLSLVGFVEELQHGLNGIGGEDDAGALSYDEAVSVWGDGEVGPHE